MADVELKIIIKSDYVDEVSKTLAEIYDREIYDDEGKNDLGLKGKAKATVLHFIKKAVVRRRKKIAKRNVVAAENDIVV